MSCAVLLALRLRLYVYTISMLSLAAQWFELYELYYRLLGREALDRLVCLSNIILCYNNYIMSSLLTTRYPGNELHRKSKLLVDYAQSILVVMLVTHRQESCTRNLCKILVQVSWLYVASIPNSHRRLNATRPFRLVSSRRVASELRAVWTELPTSLRRLPTGLVGNIETEHV